MRKKLVLCIIVCLILVGSVNSAYAQFWSKWFNKDDQAQKVEPAKEVKAPEKQVKKGNPVQAQAKEKTVKEIPYKEAEAIVEKQLAKDSQEAKSAMADAMAKKTVEDAPQNLIDNTKYDVANNASSVQNVPDDISDSEKEEQLRQTQERIGQIRKINKLNSSQKSLDHINRINKLNKQQKIINDINKFNKQQKNLENLNKLNAAKK